MIMQSKLIIKKPKLCDCFISIDYKEERIKNKELELTYGKHIINVAIEIDMSPSDRRVIGENVWSNPVEIEIDTPITVLTIKRKWHLFRHVTTEFKIEKR